MDSNIDTKKFQEAFLALKELSGTNGSNREVLAGYFGIMKSLKGDEVTYALHRLLGEALRDPKTLDEFHKISTHLVETEKKRAKKDEKKRAKEAFKKWQNQK